ncbi:D-hexose-6-phosphate mutarotase [Glaciecola sp. 1036]|uniref:D-hexose-6-phosphate mutarotase n=1 Tax=Alteromonadaceae TaxID=72275 RepID=UPI003D017243
MKNTTTSIKQATGKYGDVIVVENEQCIAVVSLFGGHLLSFTPKSSGKDLLWLSEQAIFDQATPIRGGVPVCWPWFANMHEDSSAPAHGFVRNQHWQVVEVSENKQENKIVSSILVLSPKDTANKYLPEGVNLTLSFTFSDSCDILLCTKNHSDQTIELTQALHTYFHVDNVEDVIIHGITSNYFDKPTGEYEVTTSSPYMIKGEVDRIHTAETDVSGEQQVVIETKALGNRQIKQKGHDSLVVWNPGLDRASSMKDISTQGFIQMLCVEAANTTPVKLAVGETTSLSQSFSTQTI